MAPITVIQNLAADTTHWDFRIPPAAFRPPPKQKDRSPRIKSLTVSRNEGSNPPTCRLDFDYFKESLPINRVLKATEAERYVHLSLEDLRFPDMKISDAGNFLAEVLWNGIKLNNETYHFFGHSNSQLKSRSCILIRAHSNEEIDTAVMALGEFDKINTAAKRAKRIGLLFSSQDGGLPLDPRMVKDIPDIMSDSLGKAPPVEMSDGCGLVSFEFARLLAKTLGLTFEGKTYVPSVMQIRYLGYKGVVCVSKQLDEWNKCRPPGSEKTHAHLRKSMKKFKASPESGIFFSISGYSKPYTFGRLNAEHVTLLSALKIPDAKFLAKQGEYLETIAKATSDIHSAIVLLSTADRLDLVQSLAIKGLEDLSIQRQIADIQMHTLNMGLDKKQETKVRVTIEKSRLLYGVCDEQGILKPGEVFVRVNVPRLGPRTLFNVDVIIVRNPCLHPGDILKLRAVNKPGEFGGDREECLVFSGLGDRPAASMSSGGDLDGDKFFVCWDSDLIPTSISESYSYPAAKSRPEATVTRKALIDYFARYNKASLGRVKNLYLKWLRLSPLGAMSAQCQELNALHSDSVDGAPIFIPDKLRSPPAPADGSTFILDILQTQAKQFTENFKAERAANPLRSNGTRISKPLDEEELLELLSSKSLAMSEYTRLELLFRYCTERQIDPNGYFPHINWDALTNLQRHFVESFLLPFYETGPVIWNSLKQSDILHKSDLAAHNLAGPIRLQRLYSSKNEGLYSFFHRLEDAIKLFQRMVIVLKIDARCTIVVYKSSTCNWDEDSFVGTGVRILCVTDTASLGRQASTSVSTSYLYTGPGMFQLYARQRSDTFIFLQKPGLRDVEAEVRVSIALQKISSQVQRHMGRVNREKVQAIEIHVISNRDRVGQQILDLSFEYVPTEEILRRIDNVPLVLSKRTLQTCDWTEHPDWAPILRDSIWSHADSLTTDKIRDIVRFSIAHHAPHQAVGLFRHLLAQRGSRVLGLAITIMREELPPLAIEVAQWSFARNTGEEPRDLGTWSKDVVLGVIRHANVALAFTSDILKKYLSSLIHRMSASDIVQLMWLSALSIRPPDLCRDVILQLWEIASTDASGIQKHVIFQGAAVGIEYAGQANDLCRCDETGIPRSKPLGQLVTPTSKSPSEITITYRIDAPFSARQGDHVRLRCASDKENPDCFDCIVWSSNKGTATLQALQVVPPHLSEASWSVHPCGPTATAKAEIDALVTLGEYRHEATSLVNILCGTHIDIPPLVPFDAPDWDPSLNASQIEAVRAVQDARLTLIWGPPGTGKTTIVVQILAYILRATSQDRKILLAASTHNAVDNVLERFLDLRIIDEALIVRAATDIEKVASNMRRLAVNAFENDTPQGREQSAKALQKIKDARIVFSTCAGAGLGLVRKLEFGLVVVDEASQVVEPVALIPLVKGSDRAVLVGDHVQLRPVVTPASEVLSHDRSLFERLYLEADSPDVRKCMLDTQYRFNASLAAYPSKRFYQGRLRSGIDDSMRRIPPSGFPWPKKNVGRVFISCDSPESLGSSSKKNDGQVQVVKEVVGLLQTLPKSGPSAQKDSAAAKKAISIALLTPYSRQSKELTALHLADCHAYTIDGVQGREFDIVIFSTVRSNVDGDIGFMDDERRLNVAWTRARYGRIVIGDRKTLERHELWKDALLDCEEVVLPSDQ